MGCSESRDYSYILDESTSQISKEGYLVKKSRNLGVYRRRWTLLKQNKLYTFKKKLIYHQPTEIIDLKTYNRIKTIQTKSYRSFKIESLNESIILVATSEQDRDEWMKCIRRCITNTRNIDIVFKSKESIHDNLSVKSANVANVTEISNGQFERRQALHKTIHQFDTKPQQKCSLLDQLMLPVQEEEVKMLVQIMGNVLQAPTNLKNTELNMQQISEQFKNCNICVDILLNSGFCRSDDNRVLTYDMTKFSVLEDIHKQLLLLIAGSTMKQSCELVQCTSFNAISRILGYYHLYIQCKTANTEDNDHGSIYDMVYKNVSEDYNNVKLLNDFNHLLLYHLDEFE
eukprot:406912_1